MKIIINADDFGPIDFINEGIYFHAKEGNLDSVQALANVDVAQLEKAFSNLHDAVPTGRKMDVGVHFTLTSGEPISGEDKTGRIKRWGNLVETVGNKAQFRPYSNFNFQYQSYLPLINEEFLAQRNRIETVVKKVNTQKGTDKLQVNSVSSHHNLLTIAPDLFEVYVNAGSGLRVRSPKMMPASTGDKYYGFVLPLLNSTDSREQKKMMKKLNNAFAENKYLGSKTVAIPSPAYIDVNFYKDLGSLTEGKVSDKMVDSRKKAFREMINRAISYTPNTSVESHQKVIEFVFHLGRRNAALQGVDYSAMVKDYSGVTHKYFNNREVELLALQQLALEYAQYIKENVSWNECGTVKFLKQ